MSPPGNAAREELRAQLVERFVPPNYSPRRHLLIPGTVGLTAIAVLSAFVHDLHAGELLTIPVTLVGTLGLEWRLHKNYLHQRRPRFEVLHDRHERLHHVVFTHDDMGLRGRHELAMVLLPTFAIVPLIGFLLTMGLVLGLFLPRNCALLSIATGIGFFLMYEWLHLSYHLPPTTRIGRNPLIAMLRALHQRHHDPRLMKRWNFNVTVPLFDWLHRTRWSAARAAERPGSSRRRPATDAAPPPSTDSPAHR